MDNQAGGEKISGSTGRIAPDRRWFGNTRTIGQNELDKLRDAVAVTSNDPYAFVMRRKKIPLTLLADQSTGSGGAGGKGGRVNLLETESFESTFGSKQNRKRPKLGDSIGDMAALMERVTGQYANLSDKDKRDSTALLLHPEEEEEREGKEKGKDDIPRDDLFAKGQSKRIWAELYKVLDCSDVVVEVVDARNIPGTRCHHIEAHLKKHAPHKQLVVVVNKCDLIPSWAARKWIKLLSKEYPTLAFHASINHAFGKGALITLLRQFAKLHNVSHPPNPSYPLIRSSNPLPSFPLLSSSSLSLSAGQAADLCGDHRLPQHRQVLHYQHSQGSQVL